MKWRCFPRRSPEETQRAYFVSFRLCGGVGLCCNVICLMFPDYQMVSDRQVKGVHRPVMPGSPHKSLDLFFLDFFIYCVNVRTEVWSVWRVWRVTETPHSMAAISSFGKKWLTSCNKSLSLSVLIRPSVHLSLSLPLSLHSSLKHILTDRLYR